MMWSYPDTANASARFAVDAVHVEVVLEQRELSWNVSFAVDGAANDVAYSALRIFRGVFDAVLEFLAVREPQTLVFATDREDLAEIYRKYLEDRSKRFAAAGYRVDGQRRVLRRFKPSRWSSTASPPS